MIHHASHLEIFTASLATKIIWYVDGMVARMAMDSASATETIQQSAQKRRNNNLIGEEGIRQMDK